MDTNLWCVSLQAAAALEAVGGRHVEESLPRVVFEGGERLHHVGQRLILWVGVVFFVVGRGLGVCFIFFGSGKGGG